MEEKIITPVAYIYTDFNDKFGIPRQSGRAPSARGRIVFEKEYAKTEAVRGLNGVSHLWLIFGFSKAVYTGSLTVRPPRLGGNKRAGVFATRSPNRPNGLGLSCVKLERIVSEKGKGVELLVSGADILNGTPIYDVKPYNSADAIVGATCGFADEFSEHSLTIEKENLLKNVPDDIAEAIKECLKEDPRPSYIEDGERVYGMTYAGYNVKFKVSGGVLTITEVEKTGD